MATTKTAQASAAIAGKPWLTSKTIIGIIALALPAINSLLGLEIGTEDITKVVEAALAIFGVVMGIAGRKTATQPLAARPL